MPYRDFRTPEEKTNAGLCPLKKKKKVVFAWENVRRKL